MKTARTSPGRRARLLFAMLLMALMGLLARAGYIQVVRGEEFRLRAQRQHFHRVKVPAERGCILDRNGRALATSYHSRSLAVDAKAGERRCLVVHYTVLHYADRGTGARRRLTA